jgi:hypothetical protein
MARRSARPIVLAGIAAACALAGCNPAQRQAVRHRGPTTAEVLHDPAVEDPSLAAPEELQGFFKPSRSTGTWSREARQVEASLGAVDR